MIKSDFFQEKDAYLAAKTSYASSSTDESARQMAYRQRMMDEDAYMVIVHELYDTLDFNADTLHTWLTHLGSFEGDLWLAGQRLSIGNAPAALSLLDAAIGKYQLTGDQLADIGNYQSIINLMAGKAFYELEVPTLLTVKDYLDEGGYAEAWAKSILTLYGEHFPAEYVKDGNRLEERSMEHRNLARTTQKLDWIQVTPNPAKDYVNFSASLPVEVREAVLSIVDLNGRQVLRIKLGVGLANAYTWQTDAHASGVYFYHLVAEGKTLKSGKIIIDK
ncbi:MAG: T9SS type A sorting domain-containing protein [Saprospiraceae bacterium]|nr:T9SS type A sorting domain-containing protein [Saprospiraceae bacterium]